MFSISFVTKELYGLKKHHHDRSKIYNTHLSVSLKVAYHQCFSLKYTILLSNAYVKIAIVRCGRNFTLNTTK